MTEFKRGNRGALVDECYQQARYYRDQIRCDCYPLCAECGNHPHMAVHLPSLNEGPDSPPWGHEYQPPKATDMSDDKRIAEIREHLEMMSVFSRSTASKELENHCDWLLTRLEQAREVIRPFAEHGGALEGCEPTDQWCEALTPDGESTHWLAVEHFHAARRFLEGE